MGITAVIPARLDSTRYPRKPLRKILGMPMVEHVYRRTQMSEMVDETYVATPDAEIRDVVEGFGGGAIMTGTHIRGTERVAEAAESIEAEFILKVHTDEPLIHPDMLDKAIKKVVENDDIRVANVARPIHGKDEYQNPNNIKVVTDESGNALYFSRSPIPYLHDSQFDSARINHQICVAPIERNLLLEYKSLDEGTLESIESIDMLRFLEHGYNISVVRTDRKTQSVDTPEERDRAAKLMEEDELVNEYISHAD